MPLKDSLLLHLPYLHIGTMDPIGNSLLQSFFFDNHRIKHFWKFLNTKIRTYRNVLLIN